MSWPGPGGPAGDTTASRSRWLGRGWLAFTLVVAALAALLTVVILRQYEHTALTARFAELVAGHHSRLVDGLQDPVGRLQAVGALFEASDRVTAAEFERFTAHVQEGTPRRFAFGWAARVTAADRNTFEAARRAEGLEGFTVLEGEPGTPLTPAGARDEYFPLVFFSGVGGPPAPPGFDLGADPGRRAAIEQARDQGTVVASAPASRPRPVLESRYPAEHERCVLVYPLYAGEARSVAERRERFLGLVATALTFESALGDAVEGLGDEGIRLVLSDESAGGAIVLARDASEGDVAWWSYLPFWTPTVEEDSRAFDLAGRRWLMRYAPTDRFYSLHGTGRPELGLVACAALFLLLAAYLVARHRGIEQLAATEEALRRSEGHFRSLIEAASAVILAFDPRGRITEWNPAAERVFGVPRDEAIGRTYLDRFVPESERERVTVEIERIQGGATSQGYENPVVAKGGEIRTFSWNAGPIFDKPGAPRGLIAIGTDVTDTRRVEDERKRLERKFLESQRLESLEVLAGGVAHDFNNLLFVVLGNTDLALTDLPPESPAREAVLEIKAAAERASHLAGQMLAYSGRGHFRLEPVDLNAPVTEALDALPLHLAEGVTLERALSPDPLYVRGDARQLRQLATALVVNAVEAVTPPGRVTVSTRTIRSLDHVRVANDDEGLPPGAYVTLQVADTGIGMPDDVLRRIFDPFFSTKFVGRGLGLPAARGILRGHRAHVAVGTVPGQGSVFTIYFTPALPDPEAAPRVE